MKIKYQNDNKNSVSQQNIVFLKKRISKDLNCKCFVMTKT